MDDDDLCFLGAAAQADLVRRGEVSAAALTRATLDRIGRVDPELNSFRVVCAEDAIAVATALDAQPTDEYLPLHGVPVSIKDNLDLQGHLTAWGSSAFTTPAATDAAIVTRLRSAGAIIVGKTTCSELATWPFTETDAWGATRNPWNTDFSPGGSSGGAGAASAAGLCGLAVGSDGLGSVRVPASFSGVVGLKPQRGRVPHSKVGDWGGMAVNGPLARTVADTAAFLDATAEDGPEEGWLAALNTPPTKLRVAIAWRSAAKWPMAARLGDAQRKAVDDTATCLRSLGHAVDEREVGFPVKTANSYLVRYLQGIAENVDNHVEHPSAITRRTTQMARLGRKIPERTVAWATAAEAAIAETVNKIFDDVDVVLTPGAVVSPLAIGATDGKGALPTLYLSGRRIPHFAPWNCIGQPAMSVPGGFGPNGLPVSVQLAGAPHTELTLLRAAAQIETARPWGQRRPPEGRSVK